MALVGFPCDFAPLPIRFFMLQLSVLRDQTDFVLAGLAKKRYATGPADVAAILDLDQRRRQLQTSHDSAQAEANKLASKSAA